MNLLSKGIDALAEIAVALRDIAQELQYLRCTVSEQRYVQ